MQLINISRIAKVHGAWCLSGECNLVSSLLKYVAGRCECRHRLSSARAVRATHLHYAIYKGTECVNARAIAIAGRMEHGKEFWALCKCMHNNHLSKGLHVYMHTKCLTSGYIVFCSRRWPRLPSSLPPRGPEALIPLPRCNL